MPEALDRGTKHEILNEMRTVYTPPREIPYRRVLRRRVLKRRSNRRKTMNFWTTPYHSRRTSRKVTTTPPVPQQQEHLTFETLWKENLNASEVRRAQGAAMMSYMNFKVNPCHNFYDYACGNWKEHNFIPPDRTEYDTFEILREGLDQAMRDVLADEENMLDGVSSDDARVKAKNLYQSCMNEG